VAATVAAAILVDQLVVVVDPAVVVVDPAPQVAALEFQDHLYRDITGVVDPAVVVVEEGPALLVLVPAVLAQQAQVV
jgi:hypothetical protein